MCVNDTFQDDRLPGGFDPARSMLTTAYAGDFSGEHSIKTSEIRDPTKRVKETEKITARAWDN